MSNGDCDTHYRRLFNNAASSPDKPSTRGKKCGRAADRLVRYNVRYMLVRVFAVMVVTLLLTILFMVTVMNAWPLVGVAVRGLRDKSSADRVRALLTSCAGHERTKGKDWHVPPDTSVVFDAARPVWDPYICQHVFYAGVKMSVTIGVSMPGISLSGISGAGGGGSVLLSFAEARSGPTMSYTPGSCDDRATTTVIFAFSVDIGHTWSAPIVAVGAQPGVAYRSFSDPSVGVHVGEGVLVLLTVAEHVTYVATTVTLDSLAKHINGYNFLEGSIPICASNVFPPPISINADVHPQALGLASETYCNTGHNPAVYNEKGEELIFGASLGGLPPAKYGPFLIVRKRDGEWLIRGAEILNRKPGGHRAMEPSLAVDGDDLIVNCRDSGVQRNSLGRYLSALNRLEFVSPDWGVTWRSSPLVTNIADARLSFGSTSSISHLHDGVYYTGCASSWIRNGIDVFKRLGNATYKRVYTITNEQGMSATMVSISNHPVGVSYDDGGKYIDNMLLGIVARSRRILFRRTNLN
jgi:hypothetical protein